MMDIEEICPKRPFQRVCCEDTGCPYANLPRHCVEFFLSQPREATEQ